jgi:hypothetical protein
VRTYSGLARRAAPSPSAGGPPVAAGHRTWRHGPDGGCGPGGTHELSRLRITAERREAKAPIGGVNEFDDCPADWQTKANSALDLGRRWVENVLAGLTSLPIPIPPVVATLLNRHFHTTDRKRIAEIVGHYNTIHSAMRKSVDFECETSCDSGVAGYVRTFLFWTGDVHLCPVWYRLGADARANTIVHELAHKVAGRDDEAYVWQPKYAKLSAADAIDNADSYSTFAQDAF